MQVPAGSHYYDTTMERQKMSAVRGDTVSINSVAVRSKDPVSLTTCVSTGKV